MLSAVVIALGLATTPVVAVMPFENLTGDPKLDVLQKGLADMMVTDLVSSADVTVVERARLDGVFAELALQRTKYFDPATVVRVGKMVGASHAVTGVIQEVGATVRLSVRMVDLLSSKVVVGRDVFGPRENLFELEEALVTLMLEGLALTVRPPPPPPATPLTAQTLLAFSKAVDLADQGQLVVATTQLNAVLANAPEFGAGRAAKASLLRRLRTASDARANQLEASRRTLQLRAESVVAAPGPIVQLPEYQAGRRLTYRMLRAACLAQSIRARVSGAVMPTIPEGREAELTLALDKYRDTLATLATELEQWRGKFKWLIDPQDKALVEELGLSAPPSTLLTSGVVAIVRKWQADATLKGELQVGEGKTTVLRPTLVELDRARLEPSRALYRQAFDAFGKAQPALKPESLQVSTLEAEGDGLWSSGLPTEAVEVWQRALEQFPKAPEFPSIEQKAQRALTSSDDKQRRALTKAANACSDVAQVGALLSTNLESASRQGSWPQRRLVDDVLKACPRANAATLELGLRWADKQSDCAWFDRLAALAKKVAPAVLEGGEERFATCWREP